MSALLEPAAGMGPWRVEVGSRSWYLNGDDIPAEYGGVEPERAPRARDDGGLAFPERDLPAVRTAVEQVAANPNFLRWCAQGGVEEPGAWSLLRRRKGLIYLDGPSHVDGMGKGWTVRTVELEYQHTRALLGLLSEIHQA